MADFEIRAGDTLPPLDVVLEDANGPIPLATSTVTVTVTDSTGVTKVSRSALTDPDIRGRVVMLWDAGDTDVPGLYTAEWKVIDAAGMRTFPLPSQGPYTLAVEAVQRETPLLDPDVLAADFGLGTLTGEQRRRLTGAILSAQRQVSGYLHRPLVPTQAVDKLWTWRTDDEVLSNPPLVQLISQVYDAPSGMVVLTYLGGLDAMSVPEIREYISAFAATTYRARAPLAERDVQSLTVEGQSKTFVARPNPGAPGGIPDIRTLDRWRLTTPGGVNVFSRPVRPDPFAQLPYTGQWGGGLYGPDDSGEYGPGTGGYVPVTTTDGSV